MSPSYGIILRLLGRPFARFGLRLKSVEFRHAATLVESWREFQRGGSRLIIAFRHAYGDEPQLLSYAFARLLPGLARGSGAPLDRAPHARFVHGYELPLWSGPVTRWILPRSGAIPVYHSKVHRPSLEGIRRALRDGPYPIALSPEGQVSYRAETLPRIEEGAVRLGLWCSGELASAGRSERVLILPLSIHYRYEESDGPKLGRLIAGVEKACGSPSAETPGAANWKAVLAARLGALDLKLISLAEGYYGIGTDPAKSRDERLEGLLEEALRRAEAVMGLHRAGDRIQRVYRIRQEGWDRIYPETELRRLSRLERGLADRRAGEAWYAMRHMELVDLCHYLDSEYLTAAGPDGPSFDRLVEAAYSAADLATRLTGGDISHRPSILAKKAVIAASEPIDLGAALDENSGDAKTAAKAALEALKEAYLSEIREHLGS